jgi:hypothetical protein
MRYLSHRHVLGLNPSSAMREVSTIKATIVPSSVTSPLQGRSPTKH